MDGVKLILNQDKTKFIIISDKHTRATCSKISCTISPKICISIRGSEKLGVIFDSKNKTNKLILQLYSQGLLCLLLASRGIAMYP